MHRQIAGSLTGRVTKWVVVGVWLVAVVALGGFAGKLSSVQKNDASSWLPGSAESTQGLNRLAELRSPNQIPTLVVYHRAGGLTAADYAAIDDQARRIAALPGVVTTGGRPQVVAPTDAATGRKAQLVSPDGTVATTGVTFDFGSGGWRKLPAAAERLRSIASVPGVDVHIAGQGGQAADQADAFKGLDSTLLFAAAGVVIVILLITYRSPVLWLLPVISAAVALTCAQGTVYLLAKHAGLTVNGQSQGILTVLVFGAGTDYALLLVARYREELRRHEDRHEAMAFALHRAAPAIVASAATVILGMLCLLAATMNSTRGLGPVCAIGIAIGLVVMITLLPALLVVTGRWVFWPQRPSHGSAEPTESGLWARIGRRIALRPRAVWVGTAAVLAVCCLGLLALDTSGLNGKEQFTKTFDSTTGQQLMVDHGLADTSAPVEIVSDPGTGDQVLAAVRRTGLAATVVPTPPDKPALTLAPIRGDAQSEQAYDAVRSVRAAVHPLGVHAQVTGFSATALDIGTSTARDSRVIIPLVLLVVMLVLALLLRAIVAPVVLIATVVLSFGAALGLSALLFRTVFGFAAEDQSFPLFVFVFLVALGIDYNIFLMTRVREETPRRGTRAAALVGLSATGGVITSAGVVLAATFAVLGTLPLVAFVEMGLAVALGVLLDTLIVRSVLVTALNLDLGRIVWWPSRIDGAQRPAAERTLVP